MNRVPTLIGTGGAFKGESYPLVLMQPVIVGRSRDADISLRRTLAYRMQTDAQRESDRDSKTVSSRHFQITYYSLNAIEIRNLSVNGTYLDDKPVGDTAVVTDLDIRSHVISFGTTARFRLINQSVGSSPYSSVLPPPGSQTLGDSEVPM